MQPPRDLRELGALLDERGLGRLRPFLERHALPSLRLVARRGSTTGRSRFGGAPRLPAGTEWPLRGDRPLSFLAQLRLDDLPIVALDLELPRTGLLSFFYDAEEQPWGFHPDHSSGWRVLHTSAEDLEEREAPAGARTFRACAVEHRLAMSLPTFESDLLAQAEMTEEEEDRYADLLDDLLESGDDPPCHQLLGYPSEIQWAMELQCQLASNGLDCGDESGFRDPRREVLEAGAKDWRLLLQIDTDEDGPGWMWGDLGRLYFFGRREELERGDFEPAWLVLQCY